MQTTLKDADPHDIFAFEPDFTPGARTSAPAPSFVPAGAEPSQHREPHFGPSVAAAPAAAPVAPTPSVAPAPPVASAYTVTPTYRANATNDIRLDDLPLGRAPRAPSRWAISAFWFVFAIVSAMGAAAWQHYGDRAKQVAAEWAPQVAMLTSLLPGKSAPAPEPTSAPAADQTATANQADQSAATNQLPPQSTPAAPSQDVAAATPAPAAAPGPLAAQAPAAAPAAAVAPAATAQDQTPLLQSMARDVASMGQQIAQLKASIDQLKASQDQLAQRVATRTAETRIVEPKPVPPRPHAATLPPRAGVVPPPVRRPAQAYMPPPPPASVAPLPAVSTPPQQTVAPVPLQSQQPAVVDADDDGPVVRPPMPVR